MSSPSNPIDQDFAEATAASHAPRDGGGPISKVARSYDVESRNLLGFLLKLNYEEMEIITCDKWKRLCGGVPRNSFVAVRVAASRISPEDRAFSDRLILARVTDSVPTPVQSDIVATLFEAHKIQAPVDSFTMQEFQWSGLRARIVGTFYDGGNDIKFGNDVDTFFGAHAYEVFVPRSDELETLLNSFVDTQAPLEIGRLRYTETPSFAFEQDIAIRVDPRDFAGKEYGHRTALFGKTRFGKSNTIKVIADTLLSMDEPPGQIIFDPSGEYTYWNEQDRGSIFTKHRDLCVRYSLNPRAISQEREQSIDPPTPLKINFYEQAVVGHSLIVSTYDQFHPNNRPNYLIPLLEWAPFNRGDIPSRAENASAHNRMNRTLALWFAALFRAGYACPNNMRVPVNFSAAIKTSLAQCNVPHDVRTKQNGEEEFNPNQPIQFLPGIFEHIAQLYRNLRSNDQQQFAQTFPPSGNTGDPYFSRLDETLLLDVVAPQIGRTGYTYLQPFARFHDQAGSDLFAEITHHAQAGRTVMIDMAQSDEQTRNVLSERLCRSVLGAQMNLFAEGGLGNRFIVLYFEEAHTLFRADDKDLNSIYNKLAKEGAKYNLSMVYATQSMTTMSPDLVKNTENFFIAHLDDDREVREVGRKFAFRDMADEVQRIQSKGYVRMITLSHRFALPVQIKLFEAAPAQGA